MDKKTLTQTLLETARQLEEIEAACMGATSSVSRSGDAAAKYPLALGLVWGLAHKELAKLAQLGIVVPATPANRRAEAERKLEEFRQQLFSARM
jgi:hypothetical protein